MPNQSTEPLSAPDVLINGGGVIGLAIARRWPDVARNPR